MPAPSWSRCNMPSYTSVERAECRIPSGSHQRQQTRKGGTCSTCVCNLFGRCPSPRMIHWVHTPYAVGLIQKCQQHLCWSIPQVTRVLRLWFSGLGYIWICWTGMGEVFTSFPAYRAEEDNSSQPWFHGGCQVTIVRLVT